MAKGTSLKDKREPDTYYALIQQFPLRAIASEAELDEAIQLIDTLLGKAKLDRGEQDYLDTLSDLVERYEVESHSIRPTTDAELLAHLIEAKGVNQADVARETKIAESTISEVLRGRRALNRKHIGALSGYFNVSPAVFQHDVPTTKETASTFPATSFKSATNRRRKESSDKDTRIEKAFRRIGSQLVASLDRKLADIKSEYEILDKDERKELKRWLEAVIKAGQSKTSAHIDCRVRMIIPEGPEDARSVSVSPSLFLRAVSAWERGNDFTPGPLADFD
jgi:HTH-type transcriptional regulator / antitoxin HigA